MALLFSSFVTPRQDFLGSYARCGFPHLLDFFHGAQGIGATFVFFSYQPSDWFAVAGNNNRLTALDVVEEFGEMRFCHRCLNSLHNI
jgi:hypothetical protein